MQNCSKISLSRQREEEYAREEEKEGSKIQKQSQSRTEFLCARARRPRESTRVARRKREFVYLFKVCVKSKDFSPRSIKKVPKISSAGFFLLYKILRYIKITCS